MLIIEYRVATQEFFRMAAVLLRTFHAGRRQRTRLPYIEADVEKRHSDGVS